jgi:plastocyanin
MTMHTWTGSGWDSGDLANGASFSHTFTAPGTYAFHCNIHPSMTGSVTVT